MANDPSDTHRSIIARLTAPEFAPWNIDSRSGSLCIIRDDEIEQIQGKFANIDLSKLGQSGQSIFGYSRRQFYTLIIFAISNIFSGSVISIQAPFYPKEAEEKGASPSEYGFVFGIFHLSMMIFSPIHGTLLAKISPKSMFLFGILTTGMCTILFGLLHFINDRLTFIILSFVIRIIQASAHSANISASFTIVACEFPDSISTTFAALETCFGLGLIVGPSMGGVLYELGGFTLPFGLMGSLVALMCIPTIFLLVNVTPEPKESSSDKFNFINLIKIPAVLMAGFSIAVSASSIGFLTATLEPHLREKFNLTPIYTGLVFIIDGSMYALSAPIWGRLCGQWLGQPKFVNLLGCCLTFTGFLLIGPAPFMPFDSIIWVTCLGLAVHGLGMGASFVAAFLIGLQDAVANGWPNSVATYGLVSSMWVTFLAMGSFVGPSLGGILLDNFGFKLGSLFVLITQIIMGTTTILFIWREWREVRNFENSLIESEPLLSSPSQNNSADDEFSMENSTSSSKKIKSNYYGST